MESFMANPAGLVLLNNDLFLVVLSFASDKSAMRAMRCCSQTYAARIHYELRDKYEWDRKPKLCPGWRDCIVRSAICDLKGSRAISQLAFPATLTSLVFSFGFRNIGHPLPEIFDAPLPASLTHLNVGPTIAVPVPANTFPSSLHSLEMTYKGQLVDVKLQPNLRRLRLFMMNESNDFAAFTYPSALTSLRIGGAIPAYQQLLLPTTLTELVLASSGEPDQPVSLSRLSLPSSLQLLCLGREFNSCIDELALPANLTALEFGDRFNQDVSQLRLPPSLARLRFAGQHFNQSIDALCTRYPEQCPAIIRVNHDGNWNQPGWTKVAVPNDNFPRGSFAAAEKFVEASLERAPTTPEKEQPVI